ncbi:MAG: hypothetical protein OXQ89_05585 [Rhodospirillaceae bacterium]|nr:hypothetical protein [Rhodospirillaceae bacterium]MDD9997198.1 hypothetical protein [Rhodospirillaceae bacterium]MDE0361915.1 hypothetical protein [Rhodospirillaceae bacterium]
MELKTAFRGPTRAKFRTGDRINWQVRNDVASSFFSQGEAGQDLRPTVCVTLKSIRCCTVGYAAWYN